MLAQIADLRLCPLMSCDLLSVPLCRRSFIRTNEFDLLITKPSIFLDANIPTSIIFQLDAASVLQEDAGMKFGTDRETAEFITIYFTT